MTVQEVLQTIEVEIVRIVDHKTNPTIDQIIKITIKKPVKIVEIETTTTKTDKETIRNHHIK